LSLYLSLYFLIFDLCVTWSVIVFDHLASCIRVISI
jgi:hypothetical protein